MNDETPPTAGQSTMPGPAESQRPGGSPPIGEGFFAWLRRLGIPRSDSERWLTGVAGGIAQKAGIDPLIVRGVFVVLAVLGGPGILLYLAGWLFLPDARGRIHAEELLRGRAPTGAVVAAAIVVALIALPVIIGVIGGLVAGPAGWTTWAFLGVPEWVRVTMSVLWWVVVLPAALIALIVWISRRPGTGSSAPKPGANAGERTGAWATETGDRAEAWGEQTGERAAEWGWRAGDTAASWGQRVGADAAEWGRRAGEDATAWAEREREKYEARRLGAGAVLLTLALALLVGGGTAALGLGAGLASSTVLTYALLATVAVCAVGMIIAGIRGRESGWIGFVAFIGSIALIFAPASAIAPENLRVQPFGQVDLRVAPTTSEEGLIVIAGRTTLDLTDLDRRDQGRVIEIWQFAGSIDISLPADHPTRVHMQVLGGNATEERTTGETLRSGGPMLTRVATANLTGADPDNVTDVYVHLAFGGISADGSDASAFRMTQQEESR